MNYTRLKSLISKYKFDTDDLLSEASLYIWENGIPEENYQEAITFCYKKLAKEELKHQTNRAKSLYNDDGECIDDDIYFVDERTIEQFGEGKRGVTDEHIDKTSKLSECMGLISAIYKFSNYQKSLKFSQRRVACI